MKNVREAARAASRCLQCADAPCAKACPANTKPNKFIKQMFFENYKGAAETIHKANPFGGTCGIVCPVSRLCEGACTRTKVDGKPVQIGKLQEFLHRNYPVRDLPRLPSNGTKVAVVGAGPAGLACARDMVRYGYSVTVFEKRAEPGGALRYFLSPERIDRDVVQGELNRILSMEGIQIHVDHEIRDVDELYKTYKFVFCGPGNQLGRKISPDHLSALEFLESANSKDQKLAKQVASGKRVVIIGGGSVSMDVAITCASLGSTSVTVVTVEKELRAYPDEVKVARRFGVHFLVERTLESNKGSVMRFRHSDPSIDETDVLQGDSLIFAIGQIPDETTKHLLEQAQHAGGDAVNGGDSVVRAVGEGKKAAYEIAKQDLSSSIGGPSFLEEEVPYKNTPSLEIDFCGVKFENPFCLSSSPVSNNADLCARAFDAGWAGVYYKTLNVDDSFKVFHPSPRLAAVHGAMGDDRIGIGLQNVEQISDRPLKDNLKDIAWLKKNYPSKVMGVSIMGYSVEDWIHLATEAEAHGADILELNFSCPQMMRSDAGHHVGQNFDLIEKYTAAAKSKVKIPVIAKMTPNLTDMIPAAMAAKNGGADGISAINTVRAISHILNGTSPQPNIEGVSAISGFSGHACRPIALRFISELAQSKELNLPISGMGGIYTWRDAVEFLSLGASNLQATTAVMQYGVNIVEDLIDGLQHHMLEAKIDRLDHGLIGQSVSKIKPPASLSLKTESVSFIDPEKCVGCGKCVTSCRDGAATAIELVNGKAVVDPVKCIGCNLCLHVCPVEGAVQPSIRERIQHPM